MLIRREAEQGMAVIADQAMKSGQPVKVTQGADGKLHAVKISALSQLAGRCGIAYVDHEKKVNARHQSLVNANLTNSTEHEDIAVGDVITVLYGRGRGMNNQLNDGTYNPGDKLTIDATTARFKQAVSADVVYAEVSMVFEGGRVASQDTLVPVSWNVGGAYGQTLA